jgi:hypothetical protein
VGGENDLPQPLIILKKKVLSFFKFLSNANVTRMTLREKPLRDPK